PVVHGGAVSGAYAYFVDDNGMKAQLAASRAEVRNASSDGPSGGPFGGGLLPGTFDVGILADMAAMEGSSADQLVRLNSLRDLAFLGAEATASKEKFFGYTTLSRGVLA